jgi:hypothetical protein
MESTEMVELIARGIIMAAFVRWFFSLDISLPFATVVGSASLLVVPWFSSMAGAAAGPLLHSTIAGAVVTSVVLGIIQVFRSL